ncbi:MAG TPA: 50S ribosomal protein L6 [Candidatus Paceibacterota bacterium]
MSRIGKKQIEIPAGVEVAIDGSIVKVKGPKGEISREIDSRLVVSKEGSVLSVSLLKVGDELSPLWGTYASHIVNMIEGVTRGFEKKLEIQGIGFKGEVKGNEIVFSLGFSHPLNVKIPAGLTVMIDKGIITVSGTNKDNVGAFTASIRDLKKPEPYKGKGIRYLGEHVIMKQGKKTV